MEILGWESHIAQDASAHYIPTSSRMLTSKVSSSLQLSAFISSYQKMRRPMVSLLWLLSVALTATSILGQWIGEAF